MAIKISKETVHALVVDAVFDHLDGLGLHPGITRPSAAADAVMKVLGGLIAERDALAAEVDRLGALLAKAGLS